MNVAQGWWGWSALVAASFVGACAGEVVDRRGEGNADDAIGQMDPPDDAVEPPAATTSTSSGSVEPEPTHLECGGASGSCSSEEHPSDESCYECSCRCCNEPELVDECLADAECAGWLDCMRGCDAGPACGGSCPLPCPTGNEAACYLGDCHNWICSHACGESL